MSFLKNKFGFSLIEALVVVSITVILTSVLVVHSRSSEKQIVFFRDQTLVISSILRAKAFSIETFQPELQPGLQPSPSSNRVCGWGVHFEKGSAPTTPSSLIVFTDYAPGGGASDCTSASRSYSPTGLDEKFETITLDNALSISCITVNALPGQPCVASLSDMDVTFVPPDPSVVFHPVAGAEAVIVLQLNDPNQPRTSTIRISQAGQVSVN